MKTEYCPGCNLIVAPQDPEQKVFRGKVYHGKCFQKPVPLKKEDGSGQMLLIWNGPLSEAVN